MQTRAEYKTKNGLSGADAVTAIGMEIITEGRRPTRPEIIERLGWSPSNSTITQGLSDLYIEVGRRLKESNKGLK